MAPIPDFQSLMLPFLEFASDGKEHDMSEVREALAERLGISREERAEMLPSGRQAVFNNRVAWAKVYLQMAGLVHSPRRGQFQISSRGIGVLEEKPSRIDKKYLDRFPEFAERRSGGKKDKADIGASLPETQEQATPEEALETAHARIKHDLAVDLLSRVKEASAEFFERLVVELLVRMGYGGSRTEAGKAIGRVGDEGIDGIINEDRLGLDTIFIQAKKWNGTVGRPEIQRFVGALHGKRAHKGVFLTTGSFSSEAKAYVSHIDPKVVLIDGGELASLMIDFNLGTTLVASYEVKRVDTDYFMDE